MALNPSSTVVSYQQGASLIASGMLLGSDKYIATRILGVNPVGARQGFYYKEVTGNWMNRIATRRADGAGFAKVDMSFDLTAYKVENFGIESPISDEQFAEFNPQFGGSLAERLTMQAMHPILRDYESIVSGLLFNTTTYPTGTGTGFGAGAEWDAAGGTPVNDVARCIDELADTWNGIDTNQIGVVVHRKLASKMFRNAQIRTGLGAAFTQPSVVEGNAPIPVLEQALAKALGVGEVIISQSGYRSGGTEAAGTYTADWNPFYAGVFIRGNMDMGRFYSGLGQTLAWSEMAPTGPGAVPAPISVVRYRNDPTKSDVLQLSAYLKAEVVNTIAFMLITGCDS